MSIDQPAVKQSIFKNANRALTKRVAAGIGGFLAAGLSLGLSLYETRTAEETTIVAPDIAVNAGQWNVTLHSVSLAARMPDGLRVPEGQKVLVVELTLENLTAISSNIYRRTLKLTNLPDLPEPQFYLVRDNEQLWDLQPLMPETVKVAWQIPVAQKLPEMLKVAVIGTSYKAQDNLYAAPGWFNPTEVAQVDLPIAATAEGSSQ